MAKRACGTWHKTKSGKDAPCITEDGRPCSLHPAGAHETDANGNTIVAYSESEFLEKKNAGTVFGFSHVSKEERERKAKEQAAFEAYNKAYADNIKSLEMGYNSVKNNTDDEIPDFKDYKWSSFPHTGPDGKVLSLTSEEYAKYMAEGVYQREIGNGIQAHEIYEDPNYDFVHHQHGPEWIQKQTAETEYKKEYRSVMGGHSENEKTTITAKDGHEIQISKINEAQARAELAYQHEMGNTDVTFEDIALHPNYDFKNHKPGDTDNLHKPYQPTEEVGSSPAAGVYNSRFKDVNSVNVDSMAAQGVISDKEAADYREYTVHKGNIRDVMAMSNSENGYGNANNLAAAWQRRNDKDISGVEQQELEKSVLYSLSKKSYIPEGGDGAAAKVAQMTRDRILKEAEKKYPEKVALIRRNDELEKRKKEAEKKSSDYELNPPAPPSQSEIEKRKQQREQKKRVDSVLEALRKRNAELASSPRQTRADRTPTSEFPIVGKTPRPKTDYEKLEDRAKAVGFKNFGMLSRVFGTKAATQTLEKIEAKKAEQERNARRARSTYGPNTPPPAPPQSRFRPIRPVPPAPPQAQGTPRSPLAHSRENMRPRQTMASEVMRGVRESGPSEQEMIRNARKYDNMSSYDAADDTRLYSSKPSPVPPPPPAPSRDHNFEAFSLSRDLRNGTVRRRLREDSPYHETRYAPHINRQFEDIMIESKSARETYYNRYSKLSSELNSRVPRWLRPSLKDVVYARGYQSPSWNMTRIAEVEAGSPYVANHYTRVDNIRDTAVIIKSRLKIGLATALSALFNAGKEARIRRESIY